MELRSTIVSTMRISFRKILIGMICLSLAIANGFVPKHAHATEQVNSAVIQHAHGGHDHAHHHGTAIGDDDHGLVEKTNNASTFDDSGAAPVKSNDLTANCCVASCAAIALIYATVQFSPLPLARTFVSSLQNSLVLAARTTDDPPPR